MDAPDGVLARVRGCAVVLERAAGLGHGFGFGADLGAVEVLHTSLLVQAAPAMHAAGR